MHFKYLICDGSFVCQQAQLKQKEKALQEQKEKLAQLKVVPDLSANEDDRAYPFPLFALEKFATVAFILSLQTRSQVYTRACFVNFE